MRTLPIGLAVGFLVAAFALPSAAAPILPDFGAATFLPGAPITNPYFPLEPGKLFIYSGEKVDGGDTVLELNKFFVTRDRKTVGGVDALVVRDTAFEDGLMVEKTFDYFAQDTDGNVWYLGEDTTQFEYDDDGNLIGTNHFGTWHAGVNGALPGFAMPAVLPLDFSYFQEFAAADGALDEAIVAGLNQTTTIDLGTFTGVLKILETSQIDPSLFEYKYYAPGIGLIKVEEEFDQDLNPTFIVELRKVTVPEPDMLPGFLAGLLLLAAAHRRRRLRIGRREEDSSRRSQ